jgi:filamentous hemagglutinin family protein
MTQDHRSTIGGGRLIFVFAFLVAAWIILPCGSIGFAQAPITSSGLNTRVTSSPTHSSQYDITGGTRPGNGPNLFHSFGGFNVPTNNIANFLNDSGLPTANILGRVTGGNPSNIFGTIQTTGFGNANLLLMNPAGMVFGPHASLNVGGSVSFTTANYLKLADGARFNALPGPQDTSLSAAPVAAFGFLGPNPAAIVVKGGQLSVPDGAGITLVGGDITVQGGMLENGTIQPTHLSAPNGRIHMASVASGGEVHAVTLEQSPNINGQSFEALGTIQIIEGSVLNVDGAHAGSVAIRGGSFVLNESIITADSTAGSHGGSVAISASNVKVENKAAIRSNGQDAGTPGTITIQGVAGNGSPAAEVLVDNATISSTADANSVATAGGAITITAERVVLNNGTYITADTHGAAPAGDITFNVDSLATKGGPIRLHVFPESRITNPIISQTGVLIESSSTSPDAAAGPAGNITIQGVNGPGSMAKEVTLEDTILHARSFGGTAATRPGSIGITADLVSLSNQVEIYTTSNGSSPPGDVTLNVNTLRSNLNPDESVIEGLPVLIGSPSEKPDASAGSPGKVTISGPAKGSTDPAKLIALGNTEIDTFVVSGSPPPPGQTPGPIIVTADTVVLTNRAIFVTTSAGAAPAGNIMLNVDTLRVNVTPDGQPISTANRVFLNSPGGGLDSTGGPAGTVTISGLGPESTDAARLVALHNMSITTAVEGGNPSLPPGTITITADTMTMSGKTEIFAFTFSSAPAGHLFLNVNTLRANVNPDGTLINDGQPRSLLESNSFSKELTAGKAGTITISGIRPETTDAAQLIALNNAEISTTVVGGTAATTPATVTITADTVHLTNSPNIHTDTSAAAPAGNLILHLNSLSADQKSSISSGTSGPGHGGNISINATDSVTLSNGSSITASSSGQGNAGNITINAGSQFLSNNGSVTTEASQASGGNITLQATDSIRLINSQINTSVQGGPTTAGGNITIDPAVMTLQNSQILAQANQGQGGNINITAGTFLADQTSLVSASSQFGLSGAVNIQSPVSSLSGTLATLPQQPLQVQHLLSQRCAAQGNGRLSSLVVAGRDRLPVEPGGWMMSPMTLIADGGTSPTVQPSMSPPAGRSPGSLPQYGLSSVTAACGS